MEKQDRIGFYICDRIGFYGPVILLVVIVLLLVFQRQWFLLVLVILWQIFSYVLNVVFKNTLAKPRPKPNDVTAAPSSSATYWTKHNYYGMPSGHAQAVFGQFIFIWLYFSQKWLKVGSLVVALLTAWQRINTHMHSLLQVLAGAFVGGALAKLFYSFINLFIKH